MRPQNRDDELLDWISRRLLPGQAQDASRIEKLLAAVPSATFTKAEIARILQKARGTSTPRREAAAVPSNGVHTPPKPRQARPFVLPFPPIVAWAAAACLMLAAGWLLWNSAGPDDSDSIALRPPTVYIFANGQAMLRPNGPGARVVLVDADKGQVRLDQGGVYLALTSQANTEAQVDTPLGRVLAADTRCFIYCLPKPARGKDVLAVLVLDGQVQVRNHDGFEMAEAGELIVADAAGGPEKISPAAFEGEDEEWSQAQDVLQLLHSAEILDRLKLIPPQREKLAVPAVEDIKRVDELCQKLPSWKSVERKKGASEFFTWEAKQMQGVLDEPQQKEFRHLCIQHAGFSAMLQKDVSAKLNLDPEQQNKIRKQLLSFGSAKQGLFLHGSGTSLELGKNMAKLQQLQAKTIMEFLKPDQRENWSKLCGKGETHHSEFVGIGQKGFNFNMFSPALRSEEQMWDAWLVSTAKRAKMKSQQISDATDKLRDAKKEAAAYRNTKQADFQQLAMESSLLQKSKKYDKQAWQDLEKKANTLQLPIAEIGEEWKEAVLDLLTDEQHKSLEQVSKKELPPNMGFHGLWDAFKKKLPKKGGPGFEKHK